MSTRYPHEGRTLRNFRIIVEPDRRREGLGARLFDEVLAQDEDDVR